MFHNYFLPRVYNENYINFYILNYNNNILNKETHIRKCKIKILHTNLIFFVLQHS